MANQFSLINKRRFGPFLMTQFLGAFNDNVFKNALLVMVAFQVINLTEIDSNFLINLAAGLFILPFFLFSATAGQLADKFEKSRSMRYIKIAEIFIMLGACLGFYLQDVTVLMVVLFLMGTQSTFFGPLKYGILPQHLSEKELVGGNALVETATFLAILLGMLLGTNLVAIEDQGVLYVAIAVVVFAVAGYFSSRYIPQAPAVDESLKVKWNVVTETWNIIGFTRKNRAVFLSVMGISWFWFFGAMFMTQLANLTKLHLMGDEQVYSLLLALFSIGIGLGSMLCERMSGHKIEIGLVPFGSIGLTVFGVDLYFAMPVNTSTELMSATQFLLDTRYWHFIVDVVFLGMFGGFYIVPLFALIQQRGEKAHLSRIIAGNNVLNALFMVMSSVLAIWVLASGYSIPQLLLLTAILNAVVAIYIYTLVPEFLMRFLVWMLIHTMYRVKKLNLESIPEEGPVVLVCNHVSFVDALIIAGCCRRPVRFVMYYKIFNIPLLNFIFRTAKTIPIASAKENKPMLDSAMDKIAEFLEQGEVVCIFPEGRLTGDGEIGEFKTGIERIIQRNPVPVIPMALQGLWGSFFSRKGGAAMNKVPRRFWSKIGLVAGQPVQAEEVNAADLQQRVAELRGNEA